MISKQLSSNLTILIKIQLYLGLSFLAATLVYQSGTPTWRPRVNQASIWHSSFPKVQPPNALSLPNFGSWYIFDCSISPLLKAVTEVEGVRIVWQLVFKSCLPLLMTLSEVVACSFEVQNWRKTNNPLIQSLKY